MTKFPKQKGATIIVAPFCVTIQRLYCKKESKPSGLTVKSKDLDSFLPMTQNSFIYRHRDKLIALTFWLTIITVYWGYTQTHDLAPEMLLKLMSDWLTTSPYGPLAFVTFFILQPLVFFPTVLMGITAGCLYGPGWGLLYTLIGGNGAAWVTYFVGRFFGRGILDNPTLQQNRLGYYVQRLHDNTFETIIITHLLFLPFDLVNYIAGFLQVRWKPFLFATMIGSLPGMFMFVFFGASLQGDIMGGSPELDLKTLAVSATFLLLSLAMSQYLKRREKLPANTEVQWF